MLTHSGTQYHRQDSIPKMDPNFVAIQRVLQDLTAQFYKIYQKLKTIRERVE